MNNSSEIQVHEDNKEKNYQCSICKKSYKYKSGLSRHKKFVREDYFQLKNKI